MRTPPIAVVFINLLMLGCNPYIYEAEVRTFRDAVNQSAAAFRGFNDRAQANYEKAQLEPEAEAGTPLAVMPQCAVPAGDLDNNPLEADARCLRRWAAWRAGPPTEPTPECRGKVTPAVAEGRLVAYDVSEYYQAQVEQCGLALRRGERLDFATLSDAQVFYENSLKLLPALAAYADALAGIVSAEERDELRASVGRAKTAIETQIGVVNGIAAEEPGEELISPAAVGGVGELLGAGLLAILDYRRLSALRNVVHQADPTISASASLLSQLSLPLLLDELQPEAKAFRQSVAETNDQFRGSDWFNAYANIQEERTAYLGTLENSPTDLFSAMGEAHGKLDARLQDSSVPYEELVAALADFISRAEAAYQLFTSTTGGAQPPSN